MGFSPYCAPVTSGTVAVGKPETALPHWPAPRVSDHCRDEPMKRKSPRTDAQVLPQTGARAPLQLAEKQPELLRQLVSHLREHRAQLREEWAQRIQDANLLTDMSQEEVFSEATAVYDNYVEVLETGN